MGILEYIMKIRPLSKQASILILGLDNSGKTSILHQLSDHDTTNVTPTQGFVIRSLVASGVKFNVWDTGGQRVVRFYWRQYFADADVIIYVIDAADPRRLPEACSELEHLLEEEKVAGVPMLVFANKQDLIGALSPEDVVLALNLKELRDRRWHIQGCSAKTSEGLNEGINWVVKQIRR